MTPGTGGEDVNYRKEIKEQISETLKRNPVSYFKGKKRSEETKQKIRKTITGRKLTEEWRNNISKGNKGKKRSEEVKRKISNAITGKVVTEEMKEKRINTIQRLNYQLGKKIYDIYHNYEDNVTQKELAIKYNMSSTTIWAIVNCEHWTTEHLKSII